MKTKDTAAESSAAAMTATEADMRLKGAAKDLLEALEAILYDKELIYTGGGYASLEEAGLDGTDHLAAKARAAIRKARGQ